MRQLIQIKKYLMNKMISKTNSNIILVLVCLFMGNVMSAQTLVARFGTDTSVCRSATGVIYDVITPGANPWTFTVLGGGTIASSTTTSVTVNWGSSAGIFFIRALDILTNTSLIRQVVIEGDLSLACDDLVNVSLDGNCQALITPSTMIEGNEYPDDSYDVVVYNVDGSVVPNDIVNYSHLGKKLRVYVKHLCSGIACWGYINIEDKYIPSLLCSTIPDTVRCDEDATPLNPRIGFPVPNTATVVAIPGKENCYSVTGFDLCCAVELCYTDVYTKFGCNQPVYASTVRYWTAKDCKGNATNCNETIIVQQGSLDSVRCPLSYDGIQNPYLKCDSIEPASGPYPAGWNALDNGNPSPYDYYNSNGVLIWKGTGFPTNVNCDHLAVTYRDLKIPVCGSSFKIFRNWKIFDWCSGRYIECNQLIKVEDTKAPVISCSENYIVFPMDYYSCSGTAVVNGPTNIFDCSSTTLAVSYKKAGPDGTPEDGDFRTEGVTYLGNGKVRISGLPADTSWVRYTVTDACGNSTKCTVEVIIEDNLDPVAVCDEHTVVTLGDSGTAKVFANSFNEGSFDNCALDSILVRRVSDNCNVLGSTSFGNSVTFCCEDVNLSPIMVVLRVIDKSGNYNECMVSVTVQDKIAPKITCPANKTVGCTTDIYDLTIMGRATATDNCSNVTINYKDDSTGFRCKTGIITRHWRAQDAGGRFDLCDQIITIIDPNPLTLNQITFPNEITINGCILADANPDITGKPTWPAKPCANIIAGYDDEKFFSVEGFCIKIIRHWRVIDWCLYDVNSNNSNGVWTKDQLIKVENKVKPTLTTATTTRKDLCADDNTCSAFVSLIGEATDDCTDSTLLKWTFAIDFDNNNSIDVNGTGKVASGTYRTGTHRVRWSVTDACGNTATGDQIFQIRDCKVPSPVCRTGLITVVMATNGMVTVKAKDFDENTNPNSASSDNCTPRSKLRFSFTSNVNDTTRTFKCSDIPNGVSRDTTIRMYVTDEEGLQDFCITKLTLQDNSGNICPNKLSGGMVSGLVYAPTNAPLKNATIDLIKTTSKLGDLNTPDEGNYSFIDLAEGEAYDLVPAKNDDALNGITTADIVVIQKHILGLSKFNTPLKYIAADVNNSKSITAADIVELRKLILGVTNTFKNEQKSWRFINKKFEFQDNNNPWMNNGWDEKIHIDNLQGEMKENDFIAVKIGDLNASAKTNLALASQTRTAGNIFFELENKDLEAASEIAIPVYGKWNNAIVGFQMSWTFNQNQVEFIKITSGAMTMNESNLGLTDVQKGMIHMSWNSNQGVTTSSAPLFYIVVKSKMGAVNASEVFNLSSEFLATEAYTQELDVLNIQLRERTSHQSLAKFELYQNTPNPFSEKTNIAFQSPASERVFLKIHDISGKLLLIKQIDAHSGLNVISIDKNDFASGNGVFYYTLETSSLVSTKKMILSK